MKRAICIALITLVMDMDPLTAVVNDPNILVYDEGSVEIDTEVSDYQNVTVDKPIKATIMITHNATTKIDETSFRMGGKTLQVKLENSANMFEPSQVVVTIYSFEIPGLKPGDHVLPPVQVKVGSKVYEAAPLTIVVP